MNQTIFFDEKDLPSVTIVVPVYQGEKCIGECIESLLDLDYPKEKTEIIIVDNNSTDKTINIVKKYPVKCMVETKRGACCARNTGYRNASYEFIAFTDSDCIVDRNWLREPVKHFKVEKVGGCGGHLEPTPPKNIIEEYVIYKDILSQERALKRERVSFPFLITANAIYRRKALDEVNGFDENFTVGGEDADLTWRINWSGYKIEFEPKAIVYHKHRTTLVSLLKQIKSYGSGTSYLFWKHHKKFGLNKHIDLNPYYELINSFFKIPFCLLFKKNRFQKVLPLLDFLGALFFLIGKIPTSLKFGIRYY